MFNAYNPDRLNDLNLRAGPVTDLQYEPEGIGATWGHQDLLQQQVERLRAYSEQVEAFAPTRASRTPTRLQ